MSQRAFILILLSGLQPDPMANIGSAPWGSQLLLFAPLSDPLKIQQSHFLAGGCKHRVKPDASSGFVHVKESWRGSRLLRLSLCCKINSTDSGGVCAVSFYQPSEALKWPQLEFTERN